MANVKILAMWSIVYCVSIGLSHAQVEYKQKSEPVGGKVAAKPSTDWSGSPPLFRCKDQLLSEGGVSPLTASWDPVWENEDELWINGSPICIVCDYGSFWWTDGGDGRCHYIKYIHEIDVSLACLVFEA